MTPTYFTAGPSQLYPTVAAHLANAMTEQIGSISHRSKAFEAIFAQTCDNLRQLLSIPASHRIFFFSSATEIWERLIQNCVAQHSFHLVNGSFSAKFHEFAQLMGRNAQLHEVPAGNGFALDQINVPNETECIAAIVNETSTGAMMPLADVTALALRHPDKLIFADVVTAVPAHSPDYSLIDCAYFSVQKGFGMPAGLGVAIVSERCIERAKQLQAKGQFTGTYHSFLQLEKNAAVNQTPSTPNVLFIYLLGKVAGDMIAYGADRIRRETADKAALLYQTMEQCAQLTPFVQEPVHRSITTAVAAVTGGSAPLIETLKKEGLILSSGYGPNKPNHIRIANFPAQSPDAIALLCERLTAHCG